ncbi:uncharacterized protein LOC120991127 [Bufo bufo]|uniref:uncharacterized protein LOC120991127 n=1 Tax=Bufo bufo TaxID=8384 RepID=UPI001ABD9D01|nr:uncharacterized protein LOC120991127 [Bufo bufo]XP_040275966.1 uncharacterized protein LOC120991127 [Bufo bufo]
MVKIRNSKLGEHPAIPKDQIPSGNMEKFLKKAAATITPREPKMAPAQQPKALKRIPAHSEGDSDSEERQPSSDLPLTRRYLDQALSRVMEPILTELSAVRQEVRHIGERVETLETHQAASLNHQSAVSASLRRCTAHLNDLHNALEDQENRGHRNNLRFRGIPESVLPGEITTTIISICGSLLGPDYPQEIAIERAHRALRPKPKPTEPPRDIICKFLNFPVKAAILDAARNHADLSYEDNRLEIYQDLAPSTLKKWRALKPLTNWLRSNKVLYRWSYPFGLSFSVAGKRINISPHADIGPILEDLDIPPMQIENWELYHDLGDLPDLPIYENLYNLPTNITPESQASIISTFLDSSNIPSISPDQKLKLETLFTLTEHNKALSQMPKGKSPGPDGLPVSYYKTFHEILLPIFLRFVT